MQALELKYRVHRVTWRRGSTSEPLSVCERGSDHVENGGGRSLAKGQKSVVEDRLEGSR